MSLNTNNMSRFHIGNVQSSLKNNSLTTGLEEVNELLENIILKNYLNDLSTLEIVPLDNQLKKISNIRMFKISEMIYKENEYSTYKFASVFNAVQNLNCGIFLLIDSDGVNTDFYMGVRNHDELRTTDSLNSTLRNALIGQFPGVKTERIWDKDAEKIFNNIGHKNIASVTCVAKNKDEDFNNNEYFIQGLEKFALAMQGQSYTSVILAKSSSMEQINELKHSYETIYSQLSPFAEIQLSYGSNKALNISNAFSNSSSFGTNKTKSYSKQKSSGITKGTSETLSETKQDMKSSVAKKLGIETLKLASLAAAPLTGGASLAVAAAITVAQVGLEGINPNTVTKGTTSNYQEQVSSSVSEGESVSKSVNKTEGNTFSKGTSSSKSENTQLTLKNKSLINTLNQIDRQLERIEEFESIGMWENAAYFMSNSQETTEMAAGTYKALMKGEKSGLETSAINNWTRTDRNKVNALYEYISNFIHPVFKYTSSSVILPVNASSLISSNELAIHMGLPRKSVSGFPVIEHADFGKEVVKYDNDTTARNFSIGNIFNMGRETESIVKLDCESLTMHTLITGSTGSGKSNTVYEILNQLRTLYDIPFLVIEPAKGEYKNIFGNLSNVKVYGTNPNKSEVLKINPFKFPKDIHVLEHIDRLVEIFNVCWPMYAAMPSILKEAIERAYGSAGWDTETSENVDHNRFPNFKDLLVEIENVIEESSYSSESKGDYSGALITRIKSLTTGLNKLIFTQDDIIDADLFDKQVIIDLSRVGSTETKSLIMGLLVLKLSEYRMSTGDMNSPLKHITVLEEAHHLLKRTSQEQSSDNSNLVGKSVELLSNSIAEMRTYGEGFIIADQSPGLLDMSVIRNTNTKIILRLPDISDRELVGYASSLNSEQVNEISKLRKGVAAIYQNDWVEPTLVKISKNNLIENSYHFEPNITKINRKDVLRQIVRFMINGRVEYSLYFSLDEIETGLIQLNLSTNNHIFIESLMEEYRLNNNLKLWNNKNFTSLSTRVVDILDLRKKVENITFTSSNFQELNNSLESLIFETIGRVGKAELNTLLQIMLRDMSCQNKERVSREKIYYGWIGFIGERGGKNDNYNE